MIETYLHRLDELLSASALVQDVEIVRRSIRDTEFEKVLHYRYRVQLSNGDLVEMSERVLEVHGTLEVSKYRHHWQSRTGQLIKAMGTLAEDSPGFVVHFTSIHPKVAAFFEGLMAARSPAHAT